MKGSQNNTPVEQKLAEASALLRETALQFSKVGLELDFEITIRTQVPVCISNLEINPGEKISPSI